MRELKNCADYFSFLDKDVIGYEDLPPGFFGSMTKQQERADNKVQDKDLARFRAMASMKEEAGLRKKESIF